MIQYRLWSMKMYTYIYNVDVYFYSEFAEYVCVCVLSIDWKTNARAGILFNHILCYCNFDRPKQTKKFQHLFEEN